MTKKSVIFLIALTLSLSLPSFGMAKTTIKAAGGQIGGGWYTIVSGLSEIVNQSLKDTLEMIVVPGAGVSNIATCSMGNTPVVMSFPPFIIAAKKGIAPYQEVYPKTMVIASGFGTSAQHMVTNRSDLSSYDDLSSKKTPMKITLNKPGATDEFIWRKIMEYYNFDYKDIKKWGGKVFHVGHGQAIQLIKDGHADTHFSYISVPAASIIELSVARNVNYLSVPDALHTYLIKEWSLLDYTIPAGTYKGQDQPIKTLGMSNTLMVNADLDEDLVYKITKAICEKYEDVQKIHKGASTWTPETGPKGVESLLHPGALKYYKEMGYTK